MACKECQEKLNTYRDKLISIVLDEARARKLTTLEIVGTLEGLKAAIIATNFEGKGSVK